MPSSPAKEYRSVISKVMRSTVVQGNYLGEIGRNGRLITHLNKTRWRRSGFFPERGKHLEPPTDAVPEKVEAGSKDFRIPRHLK